jgi:hypothetical protein
VWVQFYWCGQWNLNRAPGRPFVVGTDHAEDGIWTVIGRNGAGGGIYASDSSDQLVPLARKVGAARTEKSGELKSSAAGDGVDGEGSARC